MELGLTSPARQAGFNGEAGEAALFWNQAELALNNLRIAVAARPDSPRLLLNLGVALLQTNNAAEAVKAFAHVAVSEARRPDALFGWAQAELASGRFAKSGQVYEDITRLDRANFRALLGIAEAVAKSGEHDRAALRLLELLRRAPESQIVTGRLRLSLIARGRPFRDATGDSSVAAAD
ncbi:MAG: tetratricopeptide repeat protein [Pyrinomonadaceae bacterium]